MAAESRVKYTSVAESAIDKKEKKRGLKVKRTVGGVAIAACAVAGVGGALSAFSTEFGAGTAKADVCYVIGGAADGSGDGARGVMQDQGRLNGCNEGVQQIPYSGDFWPAVGQLQEKDAIAPAVDDLTNRLNNTPAWQHKVVLGFSEGSQVANGALANTSATNVDFDLIGNPNTRTGAYNSPAYNDVPLVKPIAELIGVADGQPDPRPRPGVTVEAEYTKGDGYANLGPQGLDPFAVISTADGMVNRETHRIPALDEPVVADFVDGDGVRHIVRDDGSPFTRTGDNDPAVMNPNPGPEIPPFFYGVPPIGGQELPPPPAPADVAPPAPVQVSAPEFFGEQACVAPDGSQYYTPGDAPC